MAEVIKQIPAVDLAQRVVSPDSTATRFKTGSVCLVAGGEQTLQEFLQPTPHFIDESYCLYGMAAKDLPVVKDWETERILVSDALQRGRRRQEYQPEPFPGVWGH